jgi:hypothetical protein
MVIRFKWGKVFLGCGSLTSSRRSASRKQRLNIWRRPVCSIFTLIVHDTYNSPTLGCRETRSHGQAALMANGCLSTENADVSTLSWAKAIRSP